MCGWEEEEEDKRLCEREGGGAWLRLASSVIV